MSVRKLNEKTKDGSSWVFECRYKNYEGNIKQYTSRRFHTKAQAKEGEMIFIMERKQLKEEANKNKNFNNKWYVVGNEKYLASTTFYSRKNINCKLADLKQIRIHDFRHSCASLLISQHANVTIVAKYLGHSDIEETLNTYSHFFKSDMDKIVSILIL